MTDGVGFLSTEGWGDFEDTLHSTADAHLLVELWGLSKSGFLTKEVHLKQVGATFAEGEEEKKNEIKGQRNDMENQKEIKPAARADLWSMNFNEIILVHEFSEESLDHGLYTEDSPIVKCLVKRRRE